VRDELEVRLQEIRGDPVAASKLGRLMDAVIVDIAGKFPDVPPSTAPSLLAALLSEDAEHDVSELLRTLAEAPSTVDAREP
jgi:hypothetical protein